MASFAKSQWLWCPHWCYCQVSWCTGNAFDGRWRTGVYDVFVRKRMTPRSTKADRAKVWIVYWTNNNKLKQCNKPISVQSTCVRKKSGNSVSVQRKCAGTGWRVTCAFVKHGRNIDLNLCLPIFLCFSCSFMFPVFSGTLFDWIFVRRCPSNASKLSFSSWWYDSTWRTQRSGDSEKSPHTILWSKDLCKLTQFGYR